MLTLNEFARQIGWEPTVLLAWGRGVGLNLPESDILDEETLRKVCDSLGCELSDQRQL
jgi:hypothetical protein